MNDVQAFIDRQLGIYTRVNYDNILRRLVVTPTESFYGLQNVAGATLEQDPPIFACRFAETSGYEHILALANEDGRVAIQDTSQITANTTLEGFQCHNNAVFDLAWMPRHMSFVTVSGDHTASLWDTQEGTPKRVLVFSSHTRSVKTAVFRPTDPSVFSTGARDGHILVWDIRANNQPSVVLKPDNCLMNCHSSFTPKTPGSHTKRARVESARAASITGLVFQSETTLLSCGECDGNIKVWDLRKNYSVYTREPLPKHSIPYCGSSTKNGYTNLIVDEARVRLYASCMDHVVYCFNISTYNALPEQRYIGHENGTFYIKTALSPDCRYLVSGSSDKHAYVWNVKCSTPVVRLAGHSAEVTCAAWGRARDVDIVTCSDDARHKIWRIGNEFLDPDEERELQGRAELVPSADVPSLPPWGSDRTPNSAKRKVTTPSSRRAKRTRTEEPARKTKRCLTDMMNASHDVDPASKRLKTTLSSVPEEEERLLCAGIKSPLQTTPTKRRCGDDWSYISPQPGTSFMSPTKNYERKVCRKISPRSPKRSPVMAEVRILSFARPTQDLPNFVVDGSAPHLRLMSPAKRKQGTTDWLTLMRREKMTRAEVRAEGGTGAGAPFSPTDPTPARRSSTSDKPARPRTRTLLKYFNVTIKEK